MDKMIKSKVFDKIATFFCTIKVTHNFGSRDDCLIINFSINNSSLMHFTTYIIILSIIPPLNIKSRNGNDSTKWNNKNKNYRKEVVAIRHYKKENNG